MTWENSLTEYPDSLGEALARMGSKMGVDAQGTAATGVEAGPLHCPIVPSLQLSLAAHTAPSSQHRACF